MVKKTKGPWLILGIIVAAALVGIALPKDSSPFATTAFRVFDILGKMFIDALTMIVVPLVSSSIITGVARIGKEKSFGRLGAKTFLLYIGSNFAAIVCGVLMYNLIAPAASFQGSKEISKLVENAGVISAPTISLTDLLVQIVPSNIIDAFGKSQMLSIIFFSILFGLAISKIEHSLSDKLLKFWEAVFNAMIQITHWIMKILPLGVFCLVAKVFAATGLKSLESLSLFFVTVVAGLLFFMLIVLPLGLRFIGKVSPKKHFKAMAPALVTAFSTSSSSASLPVTLDCVEKRAGVSNRISSLVIPLGSSVNLSGSALYESVAALFIASVFGLQLDMMTQITVTSLALLTSIGIAGVPSGSLVAAIVILKALGLPAEGIGLILAVDRILDMCRTTVNVFNDSCCAVIVAKLEGEQNVLKN